MPYNCCYYTVYVPSENSVCKFRHKNRKQFHNTKQYCNDSQRYLGRYKFYGNRG